MSIIICPGIHEPALTESFISGCLDRISERSIGKNTEKILTFPGQGYLTLSAFHILHFLGDRLKDRLESPVIFISFSAGVVGAIVAASGWQLLGGNIKAFIAIDGWGVPLVGNFPIHRMSHDYFTHWSSSWLGAGQDNFYAEPAVEHLSMWRSPQTVQGCWVDPSLGVPPPSDRLSAAEFLHLLLMRYQENSPENRFRD
ncbi:MAG: hypothetical protein ACSI46_19100 [Gloeotrichia echinulata DVL01]|jgi:hypothetical protein|nr:hypothetical protein [Gloeotrichia echinulata DEX184]